MGRASQRLFAIHGFVEADVTKARALIRAHREATGETSSFSHIVACVARTVAKDQAREHLGLTLPFDHVVTDGAPAARFTERLLQRIEAADGLEEALAT